MNELPEGWEKTTIGKVIEPFETADPRKNPRQQYIYIDIGSIDNSTQTITEPKTFLGKDAPSRARRVVRTGDVLFSTVRTYLKNIAQVPEYLDKALTSTGIAILRSSPALDPQYLFRWACSDSFVDEMSQAQDGTMYPAIRDQDVANGTIVLPPLNEQRRIAAKLNSFFARTKTARAELDRIPLLIERYKQAILSSAFNGDLSRKWCEQHGLEQDWTHVNLGSVASSFSYGSSAKSSKSGRIPVLRMGNIQDGKLDWGDLVYTSDDAEIEKYMLSAGDVLFNRTNSPALVGKTALYEGERKAIYAGYLIRIRCSDQLLPEYLTYCLNSPLGREYCWQVKSDAVSQSNINSKKLAAFVFPLPSVDEQEEIVARISETFDRIERIAAEHRGAVHLLEKLTESVLDKAFGGELVPQDPNDEPALVLLERIKTAREQAGPSSRRRQGRKPEEKATGGPRGRAIRGYQKAV